MHFSVHRMTPDAFVWLTHMVSNWLATQTYPPGVTHRNEPDLAHAKIRQLLIGAAFVLDNSTAIITLAITYFL